MSERCGFTVVDSEGIEQPCDRPATGWRWYQDVEHEDMLDVACDFHANEGGRRIHAAETEVAHWKDHAREAGDGFTQVCRDYARATARNSRLVARVEALAADIERQSRICNVGNTATIASRLRNALADPEPRDEGGES